MKTQQLITIAKYLILVVVSFMVGGFVVDKCSNPAMVLEEKEKTDQKKIDLSGTKEWKDKYDQTHLTLEKERLSKEVFKKSADSMAKLLKIKDNQIKQITHIKTQLEIQKQLNTHIKVDSIIKDGEHAYITYTEFNYKDKWIDIRGDVGRNDSIYIKGSDTLVRVDYVKRNWLLGKKRHYVDFTNKNPYIKIEGLKEIELKQNKEKWSIGPFFGLGIVYGQKIELKPTIGVSLQYNIIKF